MHIAETSTGTQAVGGQIHHVIGAAIAQHQLADLHEQAQQHRATHEHQFKVQLGVVRQLVFGIVEDKYSCCAEVHYKVAYLVGTIK